MRMFCGMPVQLPEKPDPVRVSVDDAGPTLPAVKDDVPVQRGPIPRAFGPEKVTDPEKLVALTVPVTVPFQSFGADQFPLTASLVCESWNATLTGDQFEDSRFPVHVPDRFGSGGGVGEVGLSAPQPTQKTNPSIATARFIIKPSNVLLDR